MKKMIAASAVVLALGLSSHAVACGEDPMTGEYTNGRLHVRISQTVPCSDRFTYQVWNAPKRIGEGKAEWEMQGTYADASGLIFKRGNTVFKVTPLDGCSDEFMCPVDLDVYVNGALKQQLVLKKLRW